MGVWLYLRTSLIPLLFVLGSPVLVTFLAIIGRTDEINATWKEILFGKPNTWKIASGFMLWIFIFQKIPSKQFFGPPSKFGYRPRYQDNGFLYYMVTTLTFTFLCYSYQWLPDLIYNDLAPLLASFNIIAAILCIILWFKGKYFPQFKEDLEDAPLIFEFYRGMEFNPRFFDIDVKQYTISRFGMMIWQLLLIAYWVVSYEKSGVNWGMTVNVILQTIYIAKFYWWERGYLYTNLDLTLDRAGFYLCWGAMNFMPGYYVFNTYYFVAHPPSVTKFTALLILILGCFCILTTYLIDRDKEIFVETKGKRSLWSDNPKIIKAQIKMKNNDKREVKLLASGFWGVSRNLNYLFEISSYYAWCLPGYNLGFLPFLIAFFINFLLVHRTYRNDEKCEKEFGPAWKEYCKCVKYKMIPYIF